MMPALWYDACEASNSGQRPTAFGHWCLPAGGPSPFKGQHGVEVTTIISTINLKGGVAKTTTTVALADALSSEKGKRVLVIDLDPQTNATVMLIGEERWKALNDGEHTLARLFKDGLQPDERQFEIEEALQLDVGGTRPPWAQAPYYGHGRVDLLPSSLDLIDVQDRLASIPPGRFHTNQPVELLYRAVNKKLADYDWVLIDCPPNLGIITLNGLRIATGYIIPTIPDILSTYGIPQIVGRVSEFSDEIGRDIHPLGIAITKYQNVSVHKNTLHRLREGKDAHVFATVIRQANQIAAAAEYTSARSTFRQKYGYQGIADAYLRLTDEIIRAAEVGGE